MILPFSSVTRSACSTSPAAFCKLYVTPANGKPSLSRSVLLNSTEPVVSSFVASSRTVSVGPRMIVNGIGVASRSYPNNVAVSTNW